MMLRISQKGVHVAKKGVRTMKQDVAMLQQRDLPAVFGVLSAGILCLSLTAAFAARVADDEVLLRSYFRFQIIQQVPKQAETLISGLSPDDAKEVKDAFTAWTSSQTVGIRDALQSRFGENAKARVEQFVSEFTVAESKSDKAFLNTLSKIIGLSEPYPLDYSLLRRILMNSWLKEDLQAASKLMSDIQTWLDMKGRVKDLPRLQIWLARDESPLAAPPSGPRNAPSLAVAEPQMNPTVSDQTRDETTGVLDTFSNTRRNRREKVVQEAQLGMQQVASERQAAEQEYASKKLSAAQAEAEAIKRQAQTLADVEKDALEQRKNSWNARIKSIVGTTISATTSAFLGGIGAKAAEEAIEAIFE